MNSVITTVGESISKEEYRHSEVISRINGLYSVTNTFIEGALNAAAKILVNTLPFKEKKELIKYLENEVFVPIAWKEAKAPYDSVIKKAVIKPLRKPLFGDAEYDYNNVVESITRVVLSVLNVDNNDANCKTIMHFLHNLTAIFQSNFSFKTPISGNTKDTFEELSFDNKHCEMWYYLADSSNPDQLCYVHCIIGKKGDACKLNCPVKLTETAYKFIRNNDMDGAYDALKEAVKIAPKSEAALYWLGYVCYRKKDYKTSIDLLERVYNSSHFNGMAGLQLIDVYYSNGDVEKALNQFLTYTESCTPSIHPGFDEIDAFRTVTKICEIENVDENTKHKVYEGIKKMRSAEGMSIPG